MLGIVLGAFVVIGVFVFWCHVTDSWNKVFRRTNPRYYGANATSVPAKSRLFVAGPTDSHQGD